MKRIVCNLCLFLALCILSGCANLEKRDINLIKVTAQTPEEAVFAISDILFEDNVFDDMRITDVELLNYTQLNKYENLTETGTVYSYELVYQFKTDDERIFIDNKVTGELVETGVWIEEAVADRCIVLYENNGTYYRILSRDTTELTDGYHTTYFRYENDEYGGSNSCAKDWLECNIIKEIFENAYGIPDLKLRTDATSNSVLRKLIRDIELETRPDYSIDVSKSKMYHMTYHEDLECISFKADLYTSDGEEVVKNADFSLCLDGGFSIYEVGENNKDVPKSLH